jgi:hypothetical protein
VSLNTAHGEVYLIQQYVIKFVSVLWQVAGSPFSSTNKIDLHNITDILLKVVLNTITLTPFRTISTDLKLSDTVTIGRNCYLSCVLFFFSFCCSINGIPACTNSKLLTTILRDERKSEITYIPIYVQVFTQCMH